MYVEEYITIPSMLFCVHVDLQVCLVLPNICSLYRLGNFMNQKSLMIKRKEPTLQKKKKKLHKYEISLLDYVDSLGKGTKEFKCSVECQLLKLLKKKKLSL